MKSLTRRVGIDPYSIAALFALIVMVLSGCATHEPNKGDSQPTVNRILPENSKVTLKRALDRDTRFIMTQAAQKVTCNHPLGCSCTLDGFATSCSFVFDCIDAGLCECVAGCDNLDP